MKKALRYAWLLLPALLAGYLLYSDPFSTLGRRGKNIYLKQPERVTLVSISGAEKTVRLEKTGENRWVTSGGYPADERRVNRLLAWLQRLRIYSVAPPDALADMPEDTGSVLRLRLQSGRKKCLDLQVWTKDHGGGLFLVQPSGRGRVYLAESFPSKAGPAEMLKTDRFAWRSLVLFALDPSTVTEVSMSYPMEPGASFVLKPGKEGDFYLLHPEGERQTPVPDERAIRYLAYFIDVRAEYFVTDRREAIADSLQKAVPFGHIRVAAGDTAEFRFYRMALPGGEGRVLSDPYRLYVWNPEEESLMVARFVDVDPILKDRSYFIP